MRGILKYFYLLYLCTNIFLPKLIFGQSSFYIFEPISVTILFLLLISGKLSLKTGIEKSYLIFMAICFLALLEGIQITSFFDKKAALLLVKFSSFILMMSAGYFVGELFSKTTTLRVLYSQILFVLITGGYVIFNMIMSPTTIDIMTQGYSQDYRLIGYTGFGYEYGRGVRMLGTTSVPMGVYVAFLFSVFSSLYIAFRNKSYLLCSIISFFGVMLTYSRSGFIALSVSLLYLLSEKMLKQRFLVITMALLFGGFLVGQQFFRIGDITRSYGVTAKMASVSEALYSQGETLQDSSRRVLIWKEALDYIGEHPGVLITGSGYGEYYTSACVSTSFLESLFFATLFQSGALGLLAILAHFYLLWKNSRRYSLESGSKFYAAIFYGYKIFIPGFFIANLVGGNSLQTDFLAPVFFFILGVCHYQSTRVRVNSNPRPAIGGPAHDN